MGSAGSTIDFFFTVIAPSDRNEPRQPVPPDEDAREQLSVDKADHLEPFLAVDLVFFGANLIKVVEGGYVPLTIAALFMTCMWTWTRGTNILFQKTRRDDVPLTLLSAPPGQ